MKVYPYGEEKTREGLLAFEDMLWLVLEYVFPFAALRVNSWPFDLLALFLVSLIYTV